MVSETPATGAADLIASRIPPGRIKWLVGCWVFGCWIVRLLCCCTAIPHQLVGGLLGGGLLGCWVVALLSCCHAVLLSCCLDALLCRINWLLVGGLLGVVLLYCCHAVLLSKNKKNYKNRLKIEPGGPKMEPECTKSGAKIEKNALNRPKWLPDGSQDPFTQNPP